MIDVVGMESGIIKDSFLQDLALVIQDVVLIREQLAQPFGNVFLITENRALVADDFVQLGLVSQNVFLVGNNCRLVRDDSIELDLVAQNAFLIGNNRRLIRHNFDQLGLVLFDNIQSREDLLLIFDNRILIGQNRLLIRQDLITAQFSALSEMLNCSLQS